MRASAFACALLVGAALPATAFAGAITAGGSVRARAGYGSNPYLQVDAPGGSATFGGSLTGWINDQGETSTTRLTGVTDIDQNANHYGRTENYLVSLSRQQTFSARLAANASVRYQDSINPRNFPQFAGENLDLVSIGQRSRSVTADGTLQWTPSTRDSFYFGPGYSHSTYASTVASNYTQYSVHGGYLRQINEKLKLGFDGSAQKVKSSGFGTSDSYQGGLRLTYDFSAVWNFDGTVSVIHQVSPFGNSSTVGFQGRLCGKYPRLTVCAGAGRNSAPSGFGGLRTDTRFDASIDYRLTSLSSVHGDMMYDISSALEQSAIPKQKFFQVGGGYSRTISPRLSGGFSGRYQNRDYGTLLGGSGSTAGGYTATIDIEYKFGRLE